MKTLTLSARTLTAAALTLAVTAGSAAATVALPGAAAPAKGLSQRAVPDDTCALPVSDMVVSHDHVMAGPLKLSGGFSRATLPNAPVGGGFLTITNTGDNDDRLVGAESPLAGHMEVHEMAMEGDVMRMRELADGLVIPAGETVELKPGGYHLMLMDLQAPLVEGETATITLIFENAGRVEVPLAIGAPNARGPAGHGMSH
ncbi:copper chaperone PCu(A)C [Ferrimonas balearica]|nr:copper chaperone PCu(A)C [Ferrimonas balearica]